MWWPFRPSSPGKEGGTTPTSVLRVGVTTAAYVTWQWMERTSLLNTWTVASTRANMLITKSRRRSNSNRKWLAENRMNICVSGREDNILLVLYTHVYKHFSLIDLLWIPWFVATGTNWHSESDGITIISPKYVAYIHNKAIWTDWNAKIYNKFSDV